MKNALIILALTSLMACAAYAQRGGTGIGVILGEPTGLSFKHWLDEDSAIDAGLGWSFDGPTSIHLHADWLWHDFSLFPVEHGALALYYGGGARFKAGRGRDGPGRRDGHRDRFGIRVPVGLAYHLSDHPVEIFGEIVPILDLAPSTKLNLNAAVGARWYFR